MPSEKLRRTGNIRRSKPERRYYSRRDAPAGERRKPPSKVESQRFDAIQPALVQLETSSPWKVFCIEDGVILRSEAGDVLIIQYVKVTV